MARIKRFPNPGSDIDMFIYIFKEIYDILSTKPLFSLYDMAIAMINKKLASSGGFIGVKAFTTSLRKDSSHDRLYNQCKMYAELYRSFGWISSSEDKKLIYCITEYGHYVANTNVNNRLIFKEAIMGIVDPNECIEKKDGLSMRPYKHFMNTIKALDGIICKSELILGPMRCSDTYNTELNKMLSYISNMRGKFTILTDEIEAFSKSDNIDGDTMGNYTRFPIASLNYLNWVKKERNDNLYPGSKNMVIMKLTKLGNEELNIYNSFIDIRLEEFKQLSAEEKESLVKISFFQQLQRSKMLQDFPFGNYEENLLILSKKYGVNPQFLFSPYQTLPSKYVDSILEINRSYITEDLPIEKNDILEEKINDNVLERFVTELKLYSSFNEISNNVKSTDIYKHIQSLKNLGVNDIKQQIIEEYSNSNQDIFYPLIGDLFNILGFNCKVSRAGTNYERFDAIIINDNSIPIEIKSPGEELNINVKAIRQALENKVVLLSRKQYPTIRDVTSLVVGFNPPNDRAEVITLVEDIKKAYDFNIGVITFDVLLEIAINKVLFNKTFTEEDIINLKGLIEVDYE